MVLLQCWYQSQHQSTHDAPVCATDQNPMDNLPEDLKVRANSLFVSVLRYIVDLLVWDKGSSLPDGMQPEGELDDQYHCMLFNDEVHTYDQVMLPFFCRWGWCQG